MDKKQITDIVETVLVALVCPLVLPVLLEANKNQED